MLLKKFQERGWWLGSANDNIGHFPSSYVEAMPETLTDEGAAKRGSSFSQSTIGLNFSS